MSSTECRLSLNCFAPRQQLLSHSVSQLSFIVDANATGFVQGSILKDRKKDLFFAAASLATRRAIGEVTQNF